MKTIKVTNAPKSMIMVLVENDNRFVFNSGDIFIMGTSNVEKFKKYIKKKAYLPLRLIASPTKSLILTR